MPTIQLIDVTLRDAHQSLWSTRMTNAMMSPYLTSIDRVGFHTVDLVGVAVLDQLLEGLLPLLYSGTV